jgi:hypothetical protein
MSATINSEAKEFYISPKENGNFSLTSKFVKD